MRVIHAYLYKDEGAEGRKILTHSNPIFLPPAYSPAVIYFGQERGWCVTCNYPTVLKEKNIISKSTTSATCLCFSLLKPLDNYK
jgi:hypothetical protein